MKEEDIKLRILNAAKEAFSKKGFSGSTTKEISSFAQVAEVTLFRHFDTKINIFYETIITFIVNPMKKLNASLMTETEQSIVESIEKRAELLRQNKDLFICIIYESHFNDEIKYLLKGIFTDVCNELMLYLEKKRKTRNTTTECMAEVFLSTIVGMIIFESLTGSEYFNDVNKIFENYKELGTLKYEK